MALQQRFQNKLFQTATVLFFLLILFTSFSIIHEQRHKAVAESWGCDADIQYLPTSDYFMATEVDCNTSEMMEDEIMIHRMEQRIVETVGYQVAFLLVPLAFIISKMYVRQPEQHENF